MIRASRAEEIVGSQIFITHPTGIAGQLLVDQQTPTRLHSFQQTPAPGDGPGITHPLHQPHRVPWIRHQPIHDHLQLPGSTQQLAGQRFPIQPVDIRSQTDPEKTGLAHFAQHPLPSALVLQDQRRQQQTPLSSHHLEPAGDRLFRCIPLAHSSAIGTVNPPAPLQELSQQTVHLEESGHRSAKPLLPSVEERCRR